MLRHLGNDAGGQPVERLRIVVVVPPHTVAEQYAVLPAVEDFGIFLRQPHRGNGGGGAENNLHPGLLRDVQERIEQFKGKHTFLRLKDRPGELRHADRTDPSLQHPLHILPPQAAVPVLRVIAHADGELIPLKVLVFTHISHLIYVS